LFKEVINKGYYRAPAKGSNNKVLKLKETIVLFCIIPV